MGKKIKRTPEKMRLKQFINDFIPVQDLRKAGFLKSIGRHDYTRIAERVCYFFGFESIYEYKLPCKGRRCDGLNCEPIPSCKAYNDLQHGQKPFEVNYSELYTKPYNLN